MPKDSIDDLFSDAVGAAENPNEGKSAAQFITAAPKPKKTQAEIDAEKAAADAKTAKTAEEKRKEEEAQAAKVAAAQAKAKAEAKAAEEAKAAKIAAAEQAKRAEAEKLESERARAAEAEQARKAEEERSIAERAEAEKRARTKAHAEAQAAAAARQSTPAVSANSSELFSVDHVTLITKVMDALRSYDPGSRDAVSAFYANDNENIIVSRVLTETNDTRKALVALIQAQKAEQVDRAFFLVSLEVKLLADMGHIMKNYTGVDLPVGKLPGNRIEYCRQLERAISGMSIDQQSNLEAIQRLLVLPISKK